MIIFVDTNVCFDFLGKREPFFEAARELFSLSEKGDITIVVSPISLTTLDYPISSNFNSSESFKRLKSFRALIKVVSVDQKIVDLALASNFPDFEDAVQYYAALSADVEIIVTRNQKDFLKSTLPVQTADEFLNTFL